MTSKIYTENNWAKMRLCCTSMPAAVLCVRDLASGAGKEDKVREFL